MQCKLEVKKSFEDTWAEKINSFLFGNFQEFLGILCFVWQVCVCGQWKWKTLSKRTKTPAFPLLLGDTFFCPNASRSQNCSGSGVPKNILHYRSVNGKKFSGNLLEGILNVTNQKNYISIDEVKYFIQKGQNWVVTKKTQSKIHQTKKVASKM